MGASTVSISADGTWGRAYLERIRDARLQLIKAAEYEEILRAKAEHMPCVMDMHKIGMPKDRNSNRPCSFDPVDELLDCQAAGEDEMQWCRNLLIEFDCATVELRKQGLKASIGNALLIASLRYRHGMTAAQAGRAMGYSRSSVTRLTSVLVDYLDYIGPARFFG